MTSAIERLRPAAGFASGVLIGLAVVTPVLGATTAALEPWSGMLTLAAAFLFAGGLLLLNATTARASRHR